ncbi:MAG: hypothetical protein JXB88_11950 [Spirochaetales bacterium]|nr:hypothetical protein [Spirochaetales bacterium]
MSDKIIFNNGNQQQNITAVQDFSQIFLFDDISNKPYVVNMKQLNKKLSKSENLIKFNEKLDTLFLPIRLYNIKFRI